MLTTIWNAMFAARIVGVERSLTSIIPFRIDEFKKVLGVPEEGDPV